MDDGPHVPAEQTRDDRPRRPSAGQILGITLVLAVLVAGTIRFNPFRSSPCASPDADVASMSPLSSATDLVVLNGGEAHIVGTTAVATLEGGGLSGDGFLTLPRADGGADRISHVSGLVPLGFADDLAGRAVLICSDSSRAVLDIATGAVLFELPGADDATGDLPGDGVLAPFDLARTGDGASGWTVTELRTGRSQPITDAIGASADMALMPIGASHYLGNTRVVRYGVGDAAGDGGVMVHAGAFAIVGSVSASGDTIIGYWRG